MLYKGSKTDPKPATSSQFSSLFRQARCRTGDQLSGGVIGDPEDDGNTGLYAGPLCASNGSKIKIGLFTDDECNVPDSDKDVDDYLMDGDGSSMKLSHALLKKTYSGDCVSCIQEPKVLGMCTRLYDFAETFGEVTDDEEEVVIDNGTDFFNSGCVKPNERYKFAVAFSAIGMIALLFT